MADALSRQERGVGDSMAAIFVVQTDWLVALQQSWHADPELQAIITDLFTDLASHEHYSWQHDLLTYKGKLVVGSVGNVRAQILQKLHGSPIGGHSGTERTYKRVKRSFYWRGMKKDVVWHVSECDVC